MASCPEEPSGSPEASLPHMTSTCHCMHYTTISLEKLSLHRNHADDFFFFFFSEWYDMQNIWHKNSRFLPITKMADFFLQYTLNLGVYIEIIHLIYVFIYCKMTSLTITLWCKSPARFCITLWAPAESRLSHLSIKAWRGRAMIGSSHPSSILLTVRQE